jgi:hypothetical protein
MIIETRNFKKIWLIINLCKVKYKKNNFNKKEITIQMKSYIYDYHKENKIITITILYNKKLYIIN